MTKVKTFWTPCLQYSDVKQGSHVIALYTIAISIVMIVLTIYMMGGGDSSELYWPFFEADVKNSLFWYGLLVCFFFVFMIVSSALLIVGLRVQLRGYLLPWLIGMMFIILFQISWSIWLLYGYYIYIQILIPAIIYWLWAAHNIYCWLCVHSYYHILYQMQSPNIEFLYD